MGLIPMVRSLNLLLKLTIDRGSELGNPKLALSYDIFPFDISYFRYRYECNLHQDFFAAC